MAASLNYQAKYAVLYFERLLFSREQFILNSMYCEKINIAKTENLKETKTIFKSKDLKMYTRTASRYEIGFFKYIYTPIMYTIFGFSVFMGLFILYGELTSFFENNFFLNFLVTHIFNPVSSVIGSTFFILFTVLWICFLCYFGFSYFRILMIYGFYWRATDTETIVNSVILIARITPALLYNFTFAFYKNKKLLDETSFFHTIGDLGAVAVLGVDVPLLMPYLLLLVFIFIMVEGDKKISKFMGFEIFDL